MNNKKIMLLIAMIIITFTIIGFVSASNDLQDNQTADSNSIMPASNNINLNVNITTYSKSNIKENLGDRKTVENDQTTVGNTNKENMLNSDTKSKTNKEEITSDLTTKNTNINSNKNTTTTQNTLITPTTEIQNTIQLKTAEEPQIIYVNTTGTGLGTSTSDYTNITYAISFVNDNLNASYIIKCDNGIYNETSTTMTEYTIKNLNLTIIGSQTTIFNKIRFHITSS
ncbi:MAG: hypothetical protein Q4Q23_03285, partial [Methanobacteriaceae archaeon]|nr:hypothetical protein [Methanobacteriaceae archaeon]